MKFQRSIYRGSEADLVGEFYYQARSAGLEVYLEVYIPSEIHRSGQMRVDAIVVKGDEVVCCVEGKRQGRQFTAGTRQHYAYTALEQDHGVPTIWLNDVKAIPSVVISIAALAEKEKRRGAA